jgi:hypothetical protein
MVQVAPLWDQLHTASKGELMKKLLACAVALFVATLPALSLGTEDVKADPELIARYALMDKGMEKGDVPAYLSVAVPDLVTIDDDVIFPTRQEFEAHLSKDIGSFSKIYSFTSKITHLQAVTDFVRADVTSTFVGDKADKKDPTTTHHYSVDLKFQHEWRRINGVWQLTRFVELGATITKDGNVLPQHS